MEFYKIKEQIKMKKILKIFFFVTVVLSALAVKLQSAYIYTYDYHWTADYLEKSSYLLMALVFFMIYIFFSKKCKSFTAKSLVAVAHSAIYIVILFFEALETFKLETKPETFAEDVKEDEYIEEY